VCGTYEALVAQLVHYYLQWSLVVVRIILSEFDVTMNLRALDWELYK
jgi:hypothetical protein